MNPLIETPIAAEETITRCKWCVNRIGTASYLLKGGWTAQICLPFVHANYTDGICPDCLAVELHVVATGERVVFTKKEVL